MKRLSPSTLLRLESLGDRVVPSRSLGLPLADQAQEVLLQTTTDVVDPIDTTLVSTTSTPADTSKGKSNDPPTSNGVVNGSIMANPIAFLVSNSWNKVTTESESGTGTETEYAEMLSADDATALLDDPKGKSEDRSGKGSDTASTVTSVVSTSWTKVTTEAAVKYIAKLDTQDEAVVVRKTLEPDTTTKVPPAKQEWIKDVAEPRTDIVPMPRQDADTPGSDVPMYRPLLPTVAAPRPDGLNGIMVPGDVAVHLDQTQAIVVSTTDGPRPAAVPSGVEAPMITDDAVANGNVGSGEIVEVPVVEEPMPPEGSTLAGVINGVWSPPALQAADNLARFIPFDPATLDAKVHQLIAALKAQTGDKGWSLTQIVSSAVAGLGLGIVGTEMARRGTLKRWTRKAIRKLRRTPDEPTA